MAQPVHNLPFFKVCNCCGEPFATGQHYLNSVDILPRGIDFKRGLLWANCICGSTHLVKLDLYPDHIQSYLRFLATHFREKYSSEQISGEEKKRGGDGKEPEKGADSQE